MMGINDVSIHRNFRVNPFIGHRRYFGVTQIKEKKY